MPGTIIFKPVQANLLKDNEFFTKMDTYCTIVLGNQEVKGSVCQSGGKQPHWNDTIIIRRSYEPTCTLKIMGKEWMMRHDSVVGTVDIDLHEIESKGRVSRTYQITCNNEPAGELFMESMFAADSSGSYKQTPYQQSYAKPPSPKKDYRSAYPQDIYSPAKQDPFDQRRIAKMNLTQIPGLEYTHQITFPHISHHLTPEEYLKMHSRQEERYQPTRRVVGQPSAPPSWAGYEKYAVQRSPEKQEHSVESTAGGTPETQKGVEEPLQQESPKIMSYCPMIGGVSYYPNREGLSYRPYSERKAASPPVETKQKSILEKFDEVANDRKPLVENIQNIQNLETNAV